LAIGINTDAYQPVEKKLQITRQILEVLYDTQQPTEIITKSALIERDLNLLADMATKNLVSVVVSITTLDAKLARTLEPRAASPRRRLKTIQWLSEAGIPVGVLLAPVIPVLTDSEIETILEASREHGAHSANYILIRLPHEVSPLFREWLQIHRPLQAAHIMQRIQDCRGGKDYDSRFESRMTGTGIFSELYRKRFKIAQERLGFHEAPQMDKLLFQKPSLNGQMSLF
jgi:DNA repair photolyase